MVRERPSKSHLEQARTSAKRTLIYVPIIHSEIDMGSLQEAVRRHKIRLVGTKKSETATGIVERIWKEIRALLDSRPVVQLVFKRKLMMALKVLIVDDSNDVRGMLRKWLVRCGMDVREAADGDSALRLIHVESPDIWKTKDRLQGDAHLQRAERAGACSSAAGPQ